MKVQEPPILEQKLDVEAQTNTSKVGNFCGRHVKCIKYSLGTSMAAVLIIPPVIGLALDTRENHFALLPIVWGFELLAIPLAFCFKFIVNKEKSQVST